MTMVAGAGVADAAGALWLAPPLAAELAVPLALELAPGEVPHAESTNRSPAARTVSRTRMGLATSSQSAPEEDET
jgi:hypothetical protein